MQTGPKKIRQEDDITFKTWNGNVVMTAAHIATFEDWVKNTIGYGSIPFVWKDPITGASTTYRLLKYGPYQVFTPALYLVPLSIEEVP